jgi:hypothetical protein
MPILKRVDDYVIEVFRQAENREFRFSEIRNAILCNEDYISKANNDDFVHGFSVKLSRTLERLRKSGVLIRHVRGHKNVAYSLSKDTREKLLKEASLPNIQIEKV